MDQRVACAFVVAVAATGCGPGSGEDRFDSDVVPVIERQCASTTCHGVAPDAAARGEVVDRGFFFVDVDGAGDLRDAHAAYLDVKRRVATGAHAGWSTFLRKPLALEQDGLPHQGGHQFPTTDHADYQAILGWLETETGGGEDLALGPLEQKFADEVQPVLRDRGCMAARCHGPLNFFGGLSFASPADGSGGFSLPDTRANYVAARHNLALGGDVTRSRLLVKALPLDAGGVVHRGGNDTFFPHVGGRAPVDDPGAQAILDWARAEREAAVGPDAAPTGIVFVRGPVAAHDFRDVTAFRPGSDVWYYPSLAPGATALNLTAAAHPDGPADVRDPAVSHDGKTVVFAMRRSPGDAMNLYTVALDGSGPAPITSDTGAVVNRWPTWGPKGRLYFASNRAGVLDQTGKALDVDLYEILDGKPVRLSYTPTPELAPRFLSVGEFRGTLAFTVPRQLGASWKAPIFRFPPDRNAAHPQADYHPHHGTTAPSEASWRIRELPDGRDVVVLLDRGNLWEGGGLAVVERQMGPDIGKADPSTLSVAGYKHAISILDGNAASSGVSQGGLYKDPEPLPDGRLVVAYAPGPLDLDDAHAQPDTGLYLVTLGTAADGTATLATRTLLVDAPGLADDEPAAVYARAMEDDTHDDAWDPAATTGEMNLVGALPLEAILSSIVPLGPKPMRTDIAGIRVFATLPQTPAATPPVDPAQIANHDDASTWWSNGTAGPRVLVAEAPLAADGSIFVSAPAGVPVRAQLLDGNGLARGTQLQIWVYLLGSQHLTVGAKPARYARLCAGCHGSTDGDPNGAIPPVTDAELDAVTGASTTLATFTGGNPRLPEKPVALATGPLPDFHFRRDLAPILTRSCAVENCHAGASPKGGLDLTVTKTAYYDTAYEALQAFGDGSLGGKKYLDERGPSAWGSYLMEKLAGKELGAPRALDFRCPPSGSGVPPLGADEIAAFARWMDLGAVYRTPGVAEP